MRLWSVHPRYLDRQGLTAAWREALLAQKVLTGTTRGYRNHPQLVRFTPPGWPPPPFPERAVRVPGTAYVPEPQPPAPPEPRDPGHAITTFLHGIADEAAARGYVFDRSKVLHPPDPDLRLEVTDGQLAHEWGHLRAKLAERSPDVLARWSGVEVPDPHPMLVVAPGPVAPWEILDDLE
jgi:hypothetical protein